jgi:HEPN domain-containing protein
MPPGGVTFLGVEALHEAVERYLKGFLVSRGWKIERTHDLSYLVDCAIQHDPIFREYAGLTESLADQFWAQHYPGGNLETHPERPFLANDDIENKGLLGREIAKKRLSG